MLCEKVETDSKTAIINKNTFDFMFITLLNKTGAIYIEEKLRNDYMKPKSNGFDEKNSA